MRDEEYVFYKDSAEKKRNGWGAHNMNRTGKGKVRFPSDNLTKKEREAMSGEVVSYDLGKPMTWKQFRGMPVDLQKTYFLNLREKYMGTENQIAAMFGVSHKTIVQTKAQFGIKTGKRGRVASDSRAIWQTFLDGGTTPTEIEPEKPPVEAEEAPKPASPAAESPEKPFSVLDGKITLYATAKELAQILTVLHGGARKKYTIAFSDAED